jgi:hypothetical protein
VGKNLRKVGNDWGSSAPEAARFRLFFIVDESLPIHREGRVGKNLRKVGNDWGSSAPEAARFRLFFIVDESLFQIITSRYILGLMSFFLLFQRPGSLET